MHKKYKLQTKQIDCDVKNAERYNDWEYIRWLWENSWTDKEVFYFEYKYGLKW